VEAAKDDGHSVQQPGLLTLRQAASVRLSFESFASLVTVALPSKH
jgi:hypothetical protein